MNQQITNEQEFDLTIAFETAAGNPATVVDVPVWTIGDGTIASLTVSPDGLSAVVTSGLPGTTTITVTAHTASGATVTGEFDVTVVLAEAGKIVFTVSNIRMKTSGPVVGTLADSAQSSIWMTLGSKTPMP
jgi:hypothetical protein